MTAHKIAPATSLEYTLPGRAATWERAGANGRRRYTSAEMREDKRAHALHAMAARPRGWSQDGWFWLSVEVYLPDLRLGDRDNYLKLVQDALQGVVWRNDKQVISGPTETRVSRHNPRTVVRVERWHGEIEEAV